MSFDGIILKGIISELNRSIIGGKINKVFEPNKNEILLGIYSNSTNYLLDLVINPNSYRVSLTTNVKPNPFNAYNFCMLLRKHLIGSKIIKIESLGLERIVTFELECYNELNDLIHKKLIIELMGKHSNIILLNENNRIIDSLRHLDIDSSSYRNIMPAYEYELPPCDKKDFLGLKNSSEFFTILTNTHIENTSILDTICSNFNGISKLSIEKALQDLNINTNFSKENCEKIYYYFKKLLYNIDIGKVSCINFKNNYVLECKESNANLPINTFIDNYYFSKETDLLFSEYRKNLSKLVLFTLKKVNTKLVNINKKIEECEDMDKFKLYGELLTANLYQINNKTLETISLHNYYDNNNLIEIPLDKRYSPAENAKIFFKKYRKLKNALEIVSLQKQEAKEELNYIESIVYELDSSKTIQDINEIYDELSENELFENIKKKTKKQILNTASSKKYEKIGTPINLKIDNFEVLIGKNNKQNDFLTTKLARKNDIWFHTKDIHGSHVILKIEKEFPSTATIEKCASLAAYYSKGKLSSNVPVDYTFVKYVKKPSGAKPGMVIYTHQKTLFVNPCERYIGIYLNVRIHS